MSDRIFHQEPPLTERELHERIDPRAVIKVEFTFERPTIRREWVSGGPEKDNGYAERRQRETVREAQLELTLPGELDVLALVNAISGEVQRQREQRR